MSIDARLYLNPDITPESIRDIFPMSKVESTCVPGYCRIFDFPNGRFINFHFQADTPAGHFVLLSMHSDKEAIEILRKIGKHFGGLLEENDCEGKLEFIYP